ncbi:MAG: hypothetical protein U0794_01265 [Isosphaeraceae bacterium]
MTPDTQKTHDRDRLIDRLVDGELAPSERRALLLELESEPDRDGWRRCALAFLENQAWGEALRPAPTLVEVKPVVTSFAPRSQPLLHRLVIAAGLLAAFGLGWLGRGGSEDVRPLAQTPIPAPVAPQAPPALAEAPSDEQLAAVEEQATRAAEEEEAWLRRGFEVDRRKRVMNLGLADGSSIPVPVDELRVQYVGNRTY